mmetsp:Transcript_10370/g.19079  ORF Transcript_10370/g.19079 Transcript_10370/m.19079 type:complete len:504 (-) Transcript_10370:19-1530(-)
MAAERVSSWLHSTASSGEEQRANLSAHYAPSGKFALCGAPTLDEIRLLAQGDQAAQVLAWLCDNIRDERYVTMVKANAELELVQQEREESPNQVETLLAAEERAKTEAQQLETESEQLLAEIAAIDRETLASNEKADSAITELSAIQDQLESLSSLEAKLSQGTSQISDTTRAKLAVGIDEHRKSILDMIEELTISSDALDENTDMQNRNQSHCSKTSSTQTSIEGALREKIGSLVLDTLCIRDENNKIFRQVEKMNIHNSGQGGSDNSMSRTSAAQKAAIQEAKQVLEELSSMLSRERKIFSVVGDAEDRKAKLSDEVRNILQRGQLQLRSADIIEEKVEQLVQGANELRDDVILPRAMQLENLEVTIGNKLLHGCPLLTTKDGVNELPANNVIQAKVLRPIQGDWTSALERDICKTLKASEDDISTEKSRESLRDANEARRELEGLLRNVKCTMNDELSSTAESVLATENALRDWWERPGLAIIRDIQSRPIENESIETLN